MINGIVSEPLCSLLAFESQKFGLPITYHRCDLRYANQDDRFEPALNILVHTDADPWTFAVPVNGDLLHVRAPVFAGATMPPIGPVVDGEVVPLAYVSGRRLVIPFDLEELENLNGVPNPVNKIWTLISDLALPKAIAYVKKYDWKAERALYAGAKVRALEASVRKMESDVEDNVWSIDAKTKEVSDLVRKNAELKETIELWKDVGKARKEEDAVREFQLLMKLVPRAYRKITFDDSVLTATTGDVKIKYEGGIYEMGFFEVKIGFDDDRLTITNMDEDKTHGGYQHPHVASDGVPCLGNISISLAKLLALKQYPPALILIGEFLRSYNPENPYIKLEKWDPDYEDDEPDYENCRENSSTRDCVGCSDDGCPYWDSRYEDCDEISDLERCLGCQDCDAWTRRVENCFEGTNPAVECMEDCSNESCPHYRNVQDCHDSSDGDECADCSRTECEFHPEEEEEEDDQSATAPEGA